jgi:hypothetical protein
MLSSHWLRMGSKPKFRPRLELLEDRTVPSGWLSMAGPATHLQVVVPEYVITGQSFKVLVEAEDASNHLATGYTGSVNLTLQPADSAATLPSLPYTFTPRDHGAHWFQLTLVATGSVAIIAADTVTSTITGSATTAVDPVPVATSLEVIAPATAAVGVPTRVEVEVLDQSGHLMHNYTGTVTLASSDTTATGTSARHTAAASLPITYTFTAPNHGEHTFLVTFNETAAATGTATTVTASATTLTSTPATVTVYPATTVTHFGIYTSPNAVSGSPTGVYVVALNASNRVVTGYTGTVSFTSTDATTKVSATRNGTPVALACFTYMFTATDAGVHEFYFTFGMIGQQTVTVSDTTATSDTGSASVDVVAQPHHRHWWW